MVKVKEADFYSAFIEVPYTQGALSRVVSEILSVEKMSWPWNRGQRSLKVIESGTIR